MSSEPVLLIEDNQGLRRALKLYLELEQHQVRTAGSLDELDRVLDDLDAPPCVVISDLHAGTSERNHDAIERIQRRFRRHTPAILLTGKTSVPQQVANAAGVRMLSKPVDPRQLASTIDELLTSTR